MTDVPYHLARRLARELDDALDALDPYGDNPDFAPHRKGLSDFPRWVLEQRGQLRLSIEPLMDLDSKTDTRSAT
jgi:hypothetical protein